MHKSKIYCYPKLEKKIFPIFKFGFSKLPLFLVECFKSICMKFVGNCFSLLFSGRIDFCQQDEYKPQSIMGSLIFLLLYRNRVDQVNWCKSTWLVCLTVSHLFTILQIMGAGWWVYSFFTLGFGTFWDMATCNYYMLGNLYCVFCPSYHLWLYVNDYIQIKFLNKLR